MLCTTYFAAMIEVNTEGTHGGGCGGLGYLLGGTLGRWLWWFRVTWLQTTMIRKGVDEGKVLFG